MEKLAAGGVYNPSSRTMSSETTKAQDHGNYVLSKWRCDETPLSPSARPVCSQRPSCPGHQCVRITCCEASTSNTRRCPAHHALIAQSAPLLIGVAFVVERLLPHRFVQRRLLLRRAGALGNLHPAHLLRPAACQLKLELVARAVRKLVTQLLNARIVRKPIKLLLRERGAVCIGLKKLSGGVRAWRYKTNHDDGTTLECVAAPTNTTSDALETNTHGRYDSASIPFFAAAMAPSFIMRSLVQRRWRTLPPPQILRGRSCLLSRRASPATSPAYRVVSSGRAELNLVKYLLELALQFARNTRF
eukprot:6177559-Pleurochrysis_carterae.AAC.1